MDTSLLREFQLDWQLTGKAQLTPLAFKNSRNLRELLTCNSGLLLGGTQRHINSGQ